jgi:hypothetical protein
MNRSARSFPRPLSEWLGATLGGALKTRGFANAEIIARWADIVGPEIAAHSEPIKINWTRAHGPDEPPEPATLVLRVEGPTVLEIQHLSALIIERVNQFFGWHAIGRIGLRQAPLSRRKNRVTLPAPDPAIVASIVQGLPDIADENLRQAIGRLGAALKQK